MSDWKVIYYYTAKMISLLPFFLLICAIIALLVDYNPQLVLSFVFPAFWALSMWVPVMKKEEYENANIRIRDAFVIAALSWLFMSLLGAMPFFLSGYLDIISAWFESMSGFTATGLTMFANVESLPRSILLWRSITQWVGGVGIVVLFLSVMIRRSKIFQSLYMAEGRTDKIVPSIVGTTRRIWFIYSLYTLLAFLTFFYLGMPAFDAMNVAMTALATGGFAVTNNSIAAYSSIIAIAVIPFMILGGLSFAAHMALFRGRVKDFFSVETIAMFVIIFLSMIFLVPYIILTNGYTVNDGFIHGSFQAVSALTGTGFSTVDLSTWGDYSKMYLTILMVFGGAYGSTSSALKLVRIVVLFYGILWYVKRRVYPESAVIPFKVGNRVYDDSEIRDVAIYTTAYIGLLIIGAMAFMACGYPASDSFFEVASAEGNVGLSVGITSITMPLYLKLLLIMEMWMGRLEIFPILVLLFSPFFKYNRDRRKRRNVPRI